MKNHSDSGIDVKNKSVLLTHSKTQNSIQQKTSSTNLNNAKRKRSPTDRHYEYNNRLASNYNSQSPNFRQFPMNDSNTSKINNNHSNYLTNKYNNYPTTNSRNMQNFKTTNNNTNNNTHNKKVFKGNN